MGEEGGVVGDEDPGGAEFSEGFVGGGVDDAGLHVGGGGEEGDLGGEVEVLVGGVEGQDAVGTEVSFVEGKGFGGEKMQGNGIAREGVDN